MTSQSFSNIVRSTSRAMTGTSGPCVPFSLASVLGKHSRTDAVDDPSSVNSNLAKKPMIVPGTPACRAPPHLWRHDRSISKLRRPIPEARDRFLRSSVSPSTQQLDIFRTSFSPTSQAALKPDSPAAVLQHRPKNIPRGPGDRTDKYAHRDMVTDPGVPAISREDIEDMEALLASRSSKKRRASEGPSTSGSTTTTASPQTPKRRRTSSSASSFGSSPSVTASPESLGQSYKRMEGMAYKQLVKARRAIEESGRVVEWLDGMRVVRSLTGSPSLRREIHHTTVKMRRMRVGTPGG